MTTTWQNLILGFIYATIYMLNPVDTGRKFVSTLHSEDTSIWTVFYLIP